MPKFDFSITFKTFKGQDMTGPEGKPLTLSDVALIAINSPLDSDAKLTGEQKAKLFRLGVKTAEPKIVELSEDEIELLKTRVGSCCTPIVVGRTFETLENPLKE